ncbi:hypothetical protein [Clostridium saccharobutylicum]|uniref:Uncharacterized protein n=1 Tax=Clostridium saccharobutylicum DSM 13864 TaxID=1345695 RepID=U5MPN9_CLOSA|nr:hypothetical protein [Clostridium saccharobutylicum]AGX42545.1 hypothetical protein CLSA_c15450 [Clostridium saccharobutylicum DSM 13864]AQR89831.1 hypothetical protein CLOSC_15340 [Clostridium saccharobutylicum]AQR99733.1 hypothetical protein CSACC_15420 [Clostridium saccharobutylicum]AQS09463.1 hypothetical protein CLOBY_15900 [Clostridium saccharobutylicum]AQS13719.1 hypothetical protein CLOSACC_15420 [Clostridium saccharobutylicum]
MNGYQLIMKIQQKMQQDQNFANKFNQAVANLNRIPGLQQQVLKIAQINNEAERQHALDRLPQEAKHSVEELLKLLNS